MRWHPESRGGAVAVLMREMLGETLRELRTPEPQPLPAGHVASTAI